MVSVSGIGSGGHYVYWSSILSILAIEKVQLLKGKSNFVKRCLMLSTVVFQSDTGRGLETTSLPLTVVLSKCPEKLQGQIQRQIKDKDNDRYKDGDKCTALKGAVDNQSALTVCFEGFCEHGSLHGRIP